jgi:FHA domain
MVGSLRTPKSTSEEDVHGDVTIGRQAITEDGIRPNDITLSISDLAISRTHCRIILDGFKNMKRKVPQEWLEFSKLFLRPSKVFLPLHIRKVIFSFLVQPRQFYIQDLGSTHGTYIQISHNVRHRVHKG